MQALGRHLIVEFWDCNAEIDSVETVRCAVMDAVKAIGATLLNLHVERFQPQGVTGLAVLAESHFSVHSWPEHGYLAADVFTCGPKIRPELSVAVLERYFEPVRVEVYELPRGIMSAAATELQLRKIASTNADANSNSRSNREIVEPRSDREILEPN